jgi:serine phosphatase RsbU (regulator of sigma subunit)
LLVDGNAVTEIAEAGPVLGAFSNASWELEQAAIGPGQQLVAVTDGITEAGGASERFGETRLRAELAGSLSPASSVSRLEGALDLFTAGDLDDDASALAVTPVPAQPAA